MKVLFMRQVWIGVIVALLVAGGFVLHALWAAEPPPPETYTIVSGDVKKIVTVSGKTEAKQIARLGFPVSGTIQYIYKTEGDPVSKDEVIATLTNDASVAEYNAALEQVKQATEQQQETIRGATQEQRAVAEKKVALAKAELDQVRKEYQQAVANARQKLYSTDLAAYPVEERNDDVPPTVSGSYLCSETGTYRLDVYPSREESGRSYRLSGLATGTYAANLATPLPLGDCGLFIQFDDEEIYSKSEWRITIPNKRSASYVSLNNAYELLLVEQAAAVAAAEEAVALAIEQEKLTVATTTSEVLAQAEANVAQAKAKLAVHEARIAEYTIRAPFAGVVSSVDMKVGEAAGAKHVVTVVNETGYELVAQIPEVDIAKVSVGDRAEMSFDAMPDQNFVGKVAFIAPVATDVSGVSYYDAHIQFTQTPAWLREGLNADIDIIVEEKRDVPTVPQQYLLGDHQVLQLTATGVRTTPIETGLWGSNGVVEVTGLPIGTELVLP